MPDDLYLIGRTPLFLFGLEKLLQANHYTFRRSLLLEEEEFLPEHPESPFLLILELGADYSANLAYCQQLLHQFPRARLLLICEDEEEKHIKSLFKVGIKAYVLPTIRPKMLCKAIDQVEADTNFIDPRLLQKWIQSTLGLGKRKKALTRREREVLRLIVDEYTTKEIAKKLFISACTAETHRLNIIQKLGVRNTAGVVREAIRAGWCL